MAKISLARKYRPKNFDDLVGQPYVSQLLKKAFLNDKIAQAYLFTGTRGVGKTSVARLLSLTINCQNSVDANPCFKCDSCKDILTGNSLDVREIDGASNNKVDDVRELRETIEYLPTFGRYKIIIIDEVHMLTTSAFNALLKTLEEPPEHLIFIFATTEAHKLPDTILSRCQRYDFKRISDIDLVDRFKYILSNESFTADESALFMIAKKANGSMRDGVSLLDQIISFSDDNISAKVVESFLGVIGDDVFIKIFLAILKKDFDEIIAIVEDIYDNGHDFGDVLDHFIIFTRNSLLAKTAPSYWLKNREYNDKIKDIILEVSEKFQERDLIRMLSILDKTNQELRFSQNDKMTFEIALFKITQLFSGISLHSAVKQYRVVENDTSNSEVNIESIAENVVSKLDNLTNEEKNSEASTIVQNKVVYTPQNSIETEPNIKEESTVEKQQITEEKVISQSELISTDEPTTQVVTEQKIVEQEIFEQEIVTTENIEQKSIEAPVTIENEVSDSSTQTIENSSSDEEQLYYDNSFNDEESQYSEESQFSNELSYHEDSISDVETDYINDDLIEPGSTYNQVSSTQKTEPRIVENIAPIEYAPISYQESVENTKLIPTVNELKEILLLNEANIYQNIQITEVDDTLKCTIAVINDFHKNTYIDIEDKISSTIKGYIPKHVIFEYISSEEAVFVKADENSPETIIENDIKNNPLLGKFIENLNLKIVKIKQ